MRRDLYQSLAEAEDTHWWFLARRHIVSVTLSTLDLPAGARVLDLGCGTGGNLRMLATHGSVFGCEPEADAAVLAARRQPGRVTRGTLPHLPFRSASFDVIVMTDVLEHIEQDLAALVAIRGLLRAQGRLVLTVPALPVLWTTRDVAHHHYRRYTRRSLHATLSEAGYQIETSSSFNTWLFLPTALVRLVQRVRPRPYENDLALPAPWLNAALGRLMMSEAGLVKRGLLPIGISLLAVATPAH
jgi:SAM-dependent methyltransferase